MAITDDDEVGPVERLADAVGPQSEDAPWVQARAVELVRSANPVTLAPARKQRLLLSLGQGGVRRGTAWLRPIVVGALLIGSGALASAAITQWPSALVRSYRALTSHGVSPSLRPHPAPARVAVGAPPAAESVPTPAGPPPTVLRRLPAPVRSHRAAVDAVSDDPLLLVQATQALRLDRNPVLARALAAAYLERHPSGTLADEAFAILIEAALDHHDPDVAALSARYLVRFPRGSFRALAERSLKPPAR